MKQISPPQVKHALLCTCALEIIPTTKLVNLCDILLNEIICNNFNSFFFQCCKAYLLKQIRGSRKGPVAIVLFGTKQGTDPWSNVSILQDLSQPSADRIKELMKILECK